MPQVTLDLVSLDNKPLVGLSRRFEGSGGTIGRDKDNTLALPDPHRRVSRLHAAISFPGGVPTITNSSAVLPISVGGMQLECGQAMPLVPGMSLDIGPYVLVVRQPEGLARPAAKPRLEPDSPPVHRAPADPLGQLATLPGLATEPEPVDAGPALAGAPLLPKDDPLAFLLGSPAQAAPAPGPLGPAAALDPFAALGIAHSPAPDRQEPQVPEPLPVRSPPPAVMIPEDFNPFDLPSASARNTADPLASMAAAAAAPSHSLTQEEESIDSMFPAAPAAPGDDFLNGSGSGDALFGARPGEPSSLLSQPDSSDPLALFGDASAAPESFARPMRDDLAEIGGAYEPPRAIDPEPAFAPPVQHLAPPVQHLAPPPPPIAQSGAARPPAVPADHAEALTRAFLSGAKLPDSVLPNGLTPEAMAMIGSLLRSATTGAIDMLSIRANIKREVQASVTIISTEANNPMKFLHDADSVLQLFLGKRMRGFMAPDEAMKDAFNDLSAHELGVIAGTRAALNEVLAKFDPTILGERLIQGSLLEKALPAMRKTRLWDLYLERYAQIRLEVEDDFQSIFGKAFVAAYEAEAARMKARSVDGGP